MCRWRYHLFERAAGRKCDEYNNSIWTTNNMEMYTYRSVLNCHESSLHRLLAWCNSSYGKSSHGGRSSSDRSRSTRGSSSAALLDTYDCFMYIIVVLELQHGRERKTCWFEYQNIIRRIRFYVVFTVDTTQITTPSTPTPNSNIIRISKHHVLVVVIVVVSTKDDTNSHSLRRRINKALLSRISKIFITMP